MAVFPTPPATHFSGALHEKSKTLRLDPSGLIRLADDECLCPEGSSRSFVDKLLLAAVADHSLRGQQPRDQTYKGSHASGHAETNGTKRRNGGGGHHKNKAGNPSMVGAESEGGGSGGSLAGSDGGEWPVYAVLAKPDSRWAENSFFQIRHFMGEDGGDLSCDPLSPYVGRIECPIYSNPSTISPPSYMLEKSDAVGKLLLGNLPRDFRFFSSTSSAAT